MFAFDAGDFVFITGAEWDLVVRVFGAFTVSIDEEAVFTLFAFSEV